MERQPARSFEDLVVWQKAHALVLSIYTRTSTFPREEIYGLTSQVRRSAVSVPANIAEGFKRRSKLDKVRLLNIAEGSLEETRYYLRLATDLGYIKDDAALKSSAEEVGRLLGSYARGILPKP
jgi:four helix bundle protein